MPKKPRAVKRGLELKPKAEVKPSAREAKGITFVVCPLCFMSRKLDKSGAWAELRHKELTKGIKGRIRFDSFDLDNGLFIQIRDASGGRGHGFSTIDGLTLKEAWQIEEYRSLLEELKAQCRRIIDHLL